MQMILHRSDFELLRDFARSGDQSAFACVVRRHVGLVFSIAFRRVEDTGAAQEITQNVFIVLAKKAWRLAADDSLPAWLYRTTLLEAKEWMRGDLRRRRREQTAVELGTTINTPTEGSTCRTLFPLLDEALLSLREKDRTAVLLRFFEGHSLREIGRSLGVGEDVAQKRVARAVDKLASYFRRRGFHTITAAAVIGALQKSAVTVSAANIDLIINGSLQAAPPALTGLAAFVARLFNQSKVQTAATCAGIAMVSIGWQAKEIHVLGKESSQMHHRVEELRAEQGKADLELERLGAESIHLEEKAAEVTRAFAREQDARAKLGQLRLRSRGLIAAQDYRWPDDLSFVRIPKWALSAIQVQGGPETPAALQAKVSSFLDLTPQEREATTQVFANYFAKVDELLQTACYETDHAISITLPLGAASKVFVLEPLGEKIRAELNQLSRDLIAVLGSRRWSMVEPNKFEFTHYEQVRLLGYTQYAWDKRQEIAVNIFASPDGESKISWQEDNGAGTGPLPCRMFIGKGSDGPWRYLTQGPPILMARVKSYITAQATAQLSNSPPK